MKKIIISIIVILMLASSVQAQTTKQRLSSIEERLTAIEEAIKNMVQSTIPTDLDIYQDANDPTIPGDIKIVSGIDVIHNCDSTTGWSAYMSMRFWSGGTHEVLPGDTLTGAISGATCYVDAVVLNTGTWAGGDATGFFIVSSISGTFQTENVNEGANNNVATLNGGAQTDATITLSASPVYEGTGSIQVSLQYGKSVTLVWSGTAKDLSGQKFIKAMLKSSEFISGNLNILFGETNFYEQKSPLIYVSGTSWHQLSYDISGIAAASRDGVTKVGVILYNNYAPITAINLDLIITSPGPSQIKAFDGDKTILMYPKLYVGSYTGTGVDDLQITIPRKGTPAAILIMRGAGTNNAGIIWTSTMTAGNSQQIEGGAILTDGIKSVGDCFFTVGTQARVNTNGDTHHYIAMWAD